MLPMFAAENPYLPQARLAVRVLRYVAEQPVFALKGGTAINLFYRDLPRLSVDLDLTYLPLAAREASLRDLVAALRRVAARIRVELPAVRVTESEVSKGKLVAQEGRAQVKVEVNLVLRGSVQAPARRQGSPAAIELFNDVEAQVLAFEDLFAGKLVAALDRQHPRDLFDVAQLLDAEGLSEPLLDAFAVYLASHGRPMSEVLAPGKKDIRRAFENEFAEMASEPVSLDALLGVRLRLVRELHRGLRPRHKEFLRSVKALEPDWSLLPFPHVANLPGVRWRLLNLEKFRREQPQRYAAARANLDRVLDAMN